VTAIVYTDGVRLVVADSGIVAPNGDAISFVGGEQGIARVSGPSGEQIAYLYDERGNLALVRDLIAGTSKRYGYDGSHALTLVSGDIGSAGVAPPPHNRAQGDSTARLRRAARYPREAPSRAVCPGVSPLVDLERWRPPLRAA